MNSDVELGKKIARDLQAEKKWMLPYREFVKVWEHQIDWNRFDYEDGQTDLHNALLLALHGYGQAGGVLSYLSIPEDEDD